MKLEEMSLIFSDETERYRYPSEPEEGDKITVRIRTGRDSIKSAALVRKTRTVCEMKKVSSDKYFDYFETNFTCGRDRVRYVFYLEEAKEKKYIFYDKTGAHEVEKGAEQDFKDAFWFAPGFHVPKWSKGAVQYQIFVDRFCNGDQKNDVMDQEYYYVNGHSKKVPWEMPVYGQDIRHFYGGDLQGVMKKLDYLQDLGVDAIYLNPIFVSPSSHKYDTQDYEHIDPHLAIIVDDKEHEMQEWEKNNGYAERYIKRVTSKRNLEASDQYFAYLCQEIHSRGMKIILDGVFNHCGSFNRWFDREGVYDGKPGFEEKGAFRDENSPYRSYFKFAKEEENETPVYDGWWGFETLPKLNYEDSYLLQKAIFSVAEKWASPPYSIDGWRLDVAADLGYSSQFNHWFWQEFRSRVKKINPNLVIIAEHYGDPSEWLLGDQWDTIMNYDAFMEPLTYFLTGMEKHSDRYVHELFQNGGAFFNTMKYNMARMQRPTLLCAMNELSNHDHSRFLTRTNKRAGRIDSAGSGAAGMHLDKCAFRSAVMVQMTWPGAPTIYYGDEAGQVGWTDPDCRRTYPWGHEDQELVSLHRDLIHLRRKHPVFLEGSLAEVGYDYGMIAYARFDEKECAVIIVNNTEEVRKDKLNLIRVGVLDGDVFTVEFETGKGGHCMPKRSLYPVYNGKLEVEVPPNSSMLLIKK